MQADSSDSSRSVSYLDLLANHVAKQNFLSLACLWTPIPQTQNNLQSNLWKLWKLWMEKIRADGWLALIEVGQPSPENMTVLGGSGWLVLMSSPPFFFARRRIDFVRVLVLRCLMLVFRATSVRS